jgi:hypothetical protein
VTYLVILVLVAVAALARLWLQQRREQTQLDTIEGFSSALEAMAPPSRPSRAMAPPRRKHSARSTRESDGRAGRSEPRRRAAVARPERSSRSRAKTPVPARRRRSRPLRKGSLLTWFVAEPRSVTPTPRAARPRRQAAPRRVSQPARRTVPVHVQLGAAHWPELQPIHGRSMATAQNPRYQGYIG